jgi:hypothetical protein
MQYSMKTSEEILEVCKNIHNLFIIVVFIYIIIYIHAFPFSFKLKHEWSKQRVVQSEQIKAIQKTLA